METRASANKEDIYSLPTTDDSSAEFARAPPAYDDLHHQHHFTNEYSPTFDTDHLIAKRISQYKAKVIILIIFGLLWILMGSLPLTSMNNTGTPFLVLFTFCSIPWLIGALIIAGGCYSYRKALKPLIIRENPVSDLDLPSSAL
jgi:hypothetical protein